MSAAKAQVFLGRLEDHISILPEAEIRAILAGIMMAADQLSNLFNEQNRGTSFVFRIDNIIERALVKLLRRLPRNKRAEALLEALSKSSSVATCAHLANRLVHEHASQSGLSTTLTETEANQFKAAALDKIKTAADDLSLLKSPNIKYILQLWETWASLDEVKSWVRTAAHSSQTTCADLIRAFADNLYGNETPKNPQGLRCNPKWFDKYLERSDFVPKVVELAAWLPAAQQYVRELEILSSGGDPDSGLSWLPSFDEF